MATGRELKVGLFVFLGIAILGVVVFLIGDERRLFSRHIFDETTFSDVEGLKTGAPVRMNGIDVGTVTFVSHGMELGDPRIHVGMNVVRSEAVRIRVDAVAKIVNKGLLGDKMVEVVAGSGGARSLDDTTIQGQDPTDLSSMLGDVGSIAKKADAVLGNLERVSKNLADEKLQGDVRSSLHSLAILMQKMAEGKGYVSRLLSDPEEAERLSHTVANFEKTSSELASAAAEVRELAGQVNHGPGFAHDLIYERGMSKTTTQFGDAAGEVALTLKGIREGNGIAKECSTVIRSSNRLWAT